MKRKRSDIFQVDFKQLQSITGLPDSTSTRKYHLLIKTISLQLDRIPPATHDSAFFFKLLVWLKDRHELQDLWADVWGEWTDESMRVYEKTVAWSMIWYMEHHYHADLSLLRSIYS